MPKTKLDRHTISKAEIETRIIKCAMARNGVYTNKALASLVSSDAGYISKCFKTGFSYSMKLRLHKVLKFTSEEFEILGGWVA